MLRNQCAAGRAALPQAQNAIARPDAPVRLGTTMNPDGTEHLDAIDVLLKIGIFLCFVIFAVALWFIKKVRDEKAEKDQNAAPPKIPKG